MTWPVSPWVPGGPSGRRNPTPNRRTSLGLGWAPAPRGPGGPDREVNKERGAGREQEERDQPRPQQPLPHVGVEAVPVERPGPNVVQDDQDHDQDEGRDPGCVVEGGEPAPRERQP